MSEVKKERFGRYLILDHLVDGGMAKICRARFLGEQADKVVAIKMVQPQFSQDDAFQKMFMGEIKVTFSLLHPNIVQTYDYGLHKGQLFVAMEYCDGRNLKEYLDRLKEKKFVFPVEISAYIISQVCQGLHYAHTHTDKLSGKSANIIHRDISPHNVMLTYDGAIKVIDFGIAKADSNDEKTQAGTIKGKLSYLAPEYLEGIELDDKYDQFAVGITLWEMLCSRKLFKAANDLAVLKKIQECRVPVPSSINPNVPKELDEIVLKALSRERTNRFENMDQLNRALIKFLYANYPDFNASDLSYFAKELFKEEIKKDREKLFEYGKIDIRPYLNDLKREGVTKDQSTPEVEHGSATQRRKAQVIDFGFEEIDQSVSRLRKLRDNKKPSIRETQKSSARKRKKPSSNNLSIDNKVVNAGLGRRGRKPKDEDQNKQYESEHHDSYNEESDERKQSSFRLVAMVGVLALAVYFGKEDLPFLQSYLGKGRIPAAKNTMTPQKVKKTKEKLQLVPTSQRRDKMNLRLEGFDKRTQALFLDGKRTKVNFLNQIVLKPNSTYTLRIESSNSRHFVTTIETQGKENMILEIPGMKQESFSYLTADKGCRVLGTLHFELYGEKRVEKMPISNPLGIAFPVRGDGRAPSSGDGDFAEYEVYYQPVKQTVMKKVKFKFEKIGERISLCDLL